MLLLALVWLKRHYDIHRAHNDPVLTPALADTGDQPLPKLSIFVSAKDEEANIEKCLTGLLAQDYPDFELLAINDRSDDRTGPIIDEIAARDSRVRPVHINELPPGWFGKGHAMHTAVQQATGDYFFFTDADCSFQSNKLLAAAVRFSQQKDVEFLSVLPALEAVGFWEKIVQPVASGVTLYWTPPHRVNDPKSRIAYANGAFMLMQRGAYEQMGGHEAIREHLNEDIYFSREAKKKGVKLRIVRSPGMFSVRMYDGFKQLWRGWARNFFGVFGTYPKLIASVLMLTLASLSPYVTAVAGLLIGSHDAKLAAAAAGIAILAQQSVLLRYYPLSGIAAPFATTYPLGAALCLGMTFDALTRVGGRKFDWRGTKYTGGA